MRSLLIALIALQSVAFATEPLPMPREVRVDQFGDRLPDGAMARLGTTRFRHYGADVLTFDPSGKRFFTTSRGDCVRVWDAATGALIDRWNLPRENCEALCFSADFRTAVIPWKDHLEIWDLPNGRFIQRLPLGDAPSISAACLSNDGRWLASADNTPREHRLRLWDLRTGKNRVVGVHEGEVTQVVFAPDALRLFSCSFEGKMLCAWDLYKNREGWNYAGKLIRGSTISGDGRRMLVEALNPSGRLAIVFDAATGKELSKAMAMDHSDVEAAISFDGSMFAVHNDGKVAIHETTGHKKLREWNIDVQALAFHPDGNALYVIESPGVVQAYSLRTGKALLPSAADGGHTGSIRNLAWSPDGMRIATAGADGDDSVRIWNAADGKLIHRLPNLIRPTAGLEFSRNSRWLWTCGHRSPLLKWDVAAGKEVKKWFIVHDDDYEKPYGQILALKMSHEGTKARMLLVGNEERERRFVATFDLESGKFEGEKGVVLPFHLHLLDHIMVGAGQVFRTATGEELPPLGGPADEDRLIDTRLSPDTWLIAGGRWTHFFRPRLSPAIFDAVVFERLTGRPLFALPHGPAGKYAFSPNGRHFAVAAPDGIHIWDLAARKEVRFIKGHDRFDAHSLDSFATAIAYSPDGKRIATGHTDTTVLVWDVGDLQAETSKAANGVSPEQFELERLWTELADSDPRKALAAVFALQDHPEHALKLLRDRLMPAKEPANVRELIARLDDDNFRQREAARKSLAEHGDAVKPAMQTALKGKLSEEQKKHVNKLLAELDSRQPPRGNDLRGIRCLMILEKLNTPESRRLVGELAKGMESARLTREAKDVQERLR
jgi:WD40 repeat protein